MSDVPARADDGRFPKGVSGNPAGRPKGKKNEIVELRQDLEIAVRKHLSIDRIKKIVDRMAQMAENGNVAAAKLLLDKAVANARDDDDTSSQQAGITIRIENATFKASRESTTPPAVEAEFTEVTHEQVVREG